MSDENYKVQLNIRGIDAGGREVALTVRGDNADEFDMLQKRYQPMIGALKALPVKTFGGGMGGKKKEVVYLPDAPKCPTHDKPLDIREWTNPQGEIRYFWSCHEKNGSEFCRVKVNPGPTAEQIKKWRELNGIEAPAAPQKPQQTQQQAQTQRPTPPPTAPNGNGNAKTLTKPATGEKVQGNIVNEVKWPATQSEFTDWCKGHNVTGADIHHAIGSDIPTWFKTHAGKAHADLAKELAATLALVP